MYRSSLRLAFLLGIAVVFVSLTSPVYAAEEINIITPKPQVTIPGLEFSEPDTLQDLKSIREDEETITTLQIPYIGEYIAGIYRYAVAMAAIIAIVMIIIGGFQWAFSGGSQDAIGSAKKRIVNAVTGLVLIAGSYTILYTINPDLVRFRSLSLTYIQGEEANLDDLVLDIPGDIIDDEDIDYGAAPPGTTRINDFEFVLVKNRNKSYTLRSTAAQDFQNAVKAYNKLSEGGQVRVNSATRTPDEQYAIMSTGDRCGCPPADDLPLNVAPEDWSAQNICKKTASACGVLSYKLMKRVNGKFQTKQVSHLGGFSVDINASVTRSNVSCRSVSGEDRDEILRSAGVANVPGLSIDADDCIPKQQQLLIKAMLEHGFCVGLKGSGLREPWHFEHVPTAKNVGKISSFCTADTDDPNLRKLHFVVN